MMRNVITLLLFFWAVLWGCEAKIHEPVGEGTRIVSLSPGITNTIIHAGFEDLIVGRSAFCFHANSDLPVVGDLREVDFERLLLLDPTDVFVQLTASGVDAHLLELAEGGMFALHIYPIDRVEEIQHLYSEVNGLFSNETKSIELLRVEDSTLPSPVLVLTQGVGGNAGLCFGTQTYIDDILQSVGVENAVAQEGWISLSLEDIGRLDPALVIVVSDSEITESSLQLIRSLGFKVLPFVHEHVLVPSSYLADVAEKIQTLNTSS